MVSVDDDNFFKWSVEVLSKELTPRGVKVHKYEKFFDSEFEFCTILLLVLLKY
jgi:hypothetical protein